MIRRGPGPVYEDAPTRQSIRFRGKFINLSAIARQQNLDHSYLSRIFSCERRPTIHYAVKLAAALGMTIDEFLEGLDMRRDEIIKRRKDSNEAFIERTRQEDEEELAALETGRAPIPRIPGTVLD